MNEELVVIEAELRALAKKLERVASESEDDENARARIAHHYALVAASHAGEPRPRRRE